MIGKQHSLKLGKVAGIEVMVNVTWLLIFALVTMNLGGYEFPTRYPVLGPWVALLMGAIAALLLFFSILTHELTHAVVARRNGLPVSRVVLFLFGGVAHMGEEPHTPLVEFKMAAAGPLASFVLAILFRGLRSAAFGLDLGIEVWILAEYLWLANMAVGIFNLLPGFPLDGGRVLRSFLWRLTGNFRVSTRIASVMGRLIGFALIGIGVFYALQGIWQGLWLVLVGYFLDRLARMSYRYADLRDAPAAPPGMDVASHMTTDIRWIPVGMNLEEVVREYFPPEPDGSTSPRDPRCFPVVAPEGLVGILTSYQLGALPREDWSRITAGEAMKPLKEVPTVRPQDLMQEVHDKMKWAGINCLPVVDSGRLMGMVSVPWPMSGP